ncbi:MAG: tRNA pseudouridine(38-40) synthase TruA [Clostridia bacterium]|nr:tRNA pseudouridine(38-40) synthase TruA [Clostridia bacterium]
MKILLTLSYVGTAYCGWQTQKNLVSVQSVVQDAVEGVFGKRYSVTGCSRTDSGVHARGFRCTVDIDAEAPHIPEEKLPIALNTKLPYDVSVLKAAYVDDSFHARYSVKSKRYEYVIHNSPLRDPFLSGRAWTVPIRLDEVVMDNAAKEFIGTHDFSAFRAVGSDVPDSVRTVFEASVRREGDMVIFSVSANGFLYNMVRIMVGTLVDLARGRLSSDVGGIIESRDRRNAGITAPPDGLTLTEVQYD